MSERLRVGVVGAGGIAQMMHLPTLADRPDLFEIVAIADVRRDVADAVAERYGVRVRATDARELFTHDAIDAVLLLASGSQKESVCQALESGKHVFVEKPLGFGVAEVEAVAAVARRHPSRVVMVGYQKRYDPVFRRAREIVRSLDDLRYVDVTVIHPDDAAYRTHHAVLPIPAEPVAIRTEDEDRRRLERLVQEGPIAAELAPIAGPSTAVRVLAYVATTSLVHDINLVRSVLGEPTRVVSSHAWRGGLAQTSVVEYPNDVRVNLSWIAAPTLKSYEETLRFVSSEARVAVSFPSPYLRNVPTTLRIERCDRTIRDGLVVEHHTLGYEEAFRRELHEFRQCVLSGARPETSVDDALGDARFIAGLVRAARG